MRLQQLCRGLRMLMRLPQLIPSGPGPAPQDASAYGSRAGGFWCLKPGSPFVCQFASFASNRQFKGSTMRAAKPERGGYVQRSRTVRPAQRSSRQGFPARPSLRGQAPLRGKRLPSPRASAAAGAYRGSAQGDDRVNRDSKFSSRGRGSRGGRGGGRDSFSSSGGRGRGGDRGRSARGRSAGGRGRGSTRGGARGAGRPGFFARDQKPALQQSESEDGGEATSVGYEWAVEDSSDSRWERNRWAEADGSAESVSYGAKTDWGDSRGGRGGFTRDRGYNGVSGGRQRGGVGVQAEEKEPWALRDNWRGDMVWGTAPVLAALQSRRRSIHALYVQEGATDAGKKKDKGGVEAAVALAKELGTEVISASKHDLNMLSENRPHQGLMLDCEALEWVSLERLPPADEQLHQSPPLWLALDEVCDPQNFGAAVRSVHFLGAAGVLSCQRNSAPLSAVVSKASAGALEVAPIHSCNNLPRTLAQAAKDGWQVLGAANEEDAVDITEAVLDRPTILVLGSEGFGLRTNVRRACQQLVRIGGALEQPAADGPQLPAIDSLNVSVATGIMLHQLLSSAKAGSDG